MPPTYYPVPIVVAGDWIDEVFINTYWGDNMAAGVPDLFSVKGQMAVASGIDAAGILDAGLDGSILVAEAAQALGLKWGRQYLTFLRKSSAQTISGAGTYKVTWDVEDVDDLNLHDNVSNNTRITFNRAGWCIIGCHLPVNSGVVLVQIRKNNSSDVAYNRPYMGAGQQPVVIVVPFLAAQNDFLEIEAVASGASAVTSATACFWVLWLGL